MHYSQYEDPPARHDTRPGKGVRTGYTLCVRTAQNLISHSVCKFNSDYGFRKHEKVPLTPTTSDKNGDLGYTCIQEGY